MATVYFLRSDVNKVCTENGFIISSFPEGISHLHKAIAKIFVPRIY